MLKWIALMLAAAAPATAATAQAAGTSPAVGADSPDHAEAVAAARDLIMATNFREQIERAAHLSSQAAFGTLLSQIESDHDVDLPEDLETELRQIVMDQIDAFIADIRGTILDDAAEVYARYFTAAEIRRLRELQTDPVMVKLQGIAPEFTTELSQIGVAAAARRQAEFGERARATVEAWLARRAAAEEAPAT